MKNKKIYLFSLLISLMLSACGFQPIYKDDYNRISANYLPVLISDNSIVVTQTFNNFFSNAEQGADLILEVSINEKELAVITNADGTIAKYKVEIYVSFNLIDKETDRNLYIDYTRGFSQYNVQVNEYDTELKFKESQNTATLNALQLIPIKIENYQSRKQ